ncbi:uncharacterized protein [Cherax quadricarinatus]|uniref:uncharacterized protein n=1 Tax=Cherax quadricarinatus TaxID=27406 RepID=UPI00387E60BD
MVFSVRRRVNTVGIQLVRGAITPENEQVLLPKIIRDTYGIADKDLYGVALNGAYRIFVKLLYEPVYEQLVEQFQDLCVDVSPDVHVRMVDVSRQYTWVKLRNVPFEADATDLRSVFRRYGVIHMAKQGMWVAGAYVGLPDGSFTLKMSLCHAIPSYVYLDDFRTQVMVSYAGQRRTCRLCGEYDHMAAECGQRGQARRPAGGSTNDDGQEAPIHGRKGDGGHGRLWSEEIEEPVVVSNLELSSLESPASPVVQQASGEDQVTVEVEDLDATIASVLHTMFSSTDVVSPAVTTASPEIVSVAVEQQQKEVVGAGGAGGDVVTPRQKAETKVVVEVHRVDDPVTNMEEDAGTRKRAAALSDSDDVLTPAQRTGKKASVDGEGRCASGGEQRQLVVPGGTGVVRGEHGKRGPQGPSGHAKVQVGQRGRKP